jgi:Fe-S-cluster containining protein
MLRDDVLQAAARPEVLEAVARVYAGLQREIDQRRPVCDASGRCCRFDEFGHRLYVTTMELAAFFGQLTTSAAGTDLGGCPFQVGGLCSVHAIRPFGCRVFFCDSTSDAWQHEQYERFHGELKRFHETLDVPYRYIEWREALKAMGIEAVPVREAASGGPARLSLRQLRL